MDVFGAHLQGRSNSAKERAARTERQRARADIELESKGTPEERLLAFDGWVRAQLLKHLSWPDDEFTKTRLVEQCRLELDSPVLELFRRGWLLDGKRLAKHITRMLEDIGEAQRAGKIKDFWPYYKASVSRYIGANAEEIQLEARAVGTHIANLMKHLGGHIKPTDTSIPELVAARKDETLREKLARERRRKDAAAAEKSQMKLL